MFHISVEEEARLEWHIADGHIITIMRSLNNSWILLLSKSVYRISHYEANQRPINFLYNFQSTWIDHDKSNNSQVSI